MLFLNAHKLQWHSPEIHACFLCMRVICTAGCWAFMGFILKCIFCYSHFSRCMHICVYVWCRWTSCMEKWCVLLKSLIYEHYRCQVLFWCFSTYCIQYFILFQFMAGGVRGRISIKPKFLFCFRVWIFIFITFSIRIIAYTKWV